MNMEKNMLLEEKKEASDFEIKTIEFLGEVVEHGWIPNLFENMSMPDETHVYVRRVGNHLEIGAAQVNFIR